MIRSLLFSLLLAQSADPAPSAPPPEAPRAEHVRALKDPVVWELDAGTRVALVEDHRVPLVELRIQLPAGSYTPWFQENDGEAAFSYMYYDPDGALRARADALAASLSFSVKQQRSTLGVSCLKRDLPEVLRLVQDVLANTEYDKKELKRGNQGQTIGWKTNLKDPQFRLIQAVSGLLFDPADTRNRAYQEPEPMQTKAAVLAATRDQLLRLPGRVIGFAGDLTQNEANTLAKDLLPPVGAPPEGLDPVFLDLKGGRADTEVPLDNLTQIYFALAREGITYKDPDYASFLIANHVLGGHFFSRLYVALRHEGGETYGAYTSGGPSTQPEPYALSTFTRVENLSTTEEKLRKTLAVFHADGVTAVELEEAKSTLKGQLLFDQQAPGDVLDETLWELSLGLPAGFERQQAEAAAALTQDQVNGFIKRFYDPALFTMVKVVPKP